MASSKLNRLTAREEEYLMKYGGLPNDWEDLRAHVLEKYPFKQAQLDAALDRIESLTWSSVEFVLNLVPQPTPRPRTDGTHFYVKYAAENRRIIKRYIEANIVGTRCEIWIDAYLPTPVSQLNNAEIYIAECKMIHPIGSMDVDNLMKTYLDMIQGHLIVNDSIVTCAHLEKFYSIKPRVEIRLAYQNGFDSRYNEKRITNSKWYKNYFPESGNEILSGTIHSDT